jgi:hypothetical protein
MIHFHVTSFDIKKYVAVMCMHSSGNLIFIETSHYIAKAGLKFSILLPQPPEYWDYTHVSYHTWLRKFNFPLEV